MELTEDQKKEIEQYALAGLSFSECLRLLCKEKGQRAALEILAFPFFHRAKAQAKFEIGKFYAECAKSDPNHAFNYLTHVGGWHPAKPLDLTSINTLEKYEEVRADLDAVYQKLIDQEPVKLVKDEN